MADAHDTHGRKDRLTVSISAEVLRLLDRKIDGVYLRNRSHAIESLLMQSLGLSNIHHAVFLAGGPQAENLKPIFLQTVQAVRALGISRLTVIYGHWGAKLKEQLSAEETSGLDVRFFAAASGDAGAFRDYRQEFRQGAMLVINTDRWPEVDLSELIAFHQRSSRVATVALTDRETAQGVYVFAPDIFRYIAAGSFQLFGAEVFPLLRQYNLLIEFQVERGNQAE